MTCQGSSIVPKLGVKVSTRLAAIMILDDRPSLESNRSPLCRSAKANHKYTKLAAVLPLCYQVWDDGDREILFVLDSTRALAKAAKREFQGRKSHGSHHVWARIEREPTVAIFLKRANKTTSPPYR